MTFIQFLVPGMVLAIMCSTGNVLAEPDTPFPITVAEAREMQKEVALPITAFYETEVPLPAGKPGQLIRSEPFDGYNFPDGTTPEEMGIRVVRFLYHSRAVDGTDVPASGVVLIPYGKPPAGGWPVVVWAHGTSGVGRMAAPSLRKDLYYGWQGLLEWPMLGYAVIAPDYAGLGTNVHHQYLAAPAQANDVIYAVPAARAAVPGLGEKWVAVGHSQGGGAVVKAAEMDVTILDPGYLGAIALAPAGDLQAGAAQINDSMVRGYAAFLAFGIKAVFPEFKYHDLLTPEATALMPVASDNGWLVTMATFAYEVPAGKVLKSNWMENASFRQMRDLSMLGERPTRGPLLLVAGIDDLTVPVDSIAATYERMLKQGSDVEYRTYAGLDHDPLVFGTFRAQFRWVEDRFAGKPVGGQ